MNTARTAGALVPAGMLLIVLVMGLWFICERRKKEDDDRKR